MAGARLELQWLMVVAAAAEEEEGQMHRGRR
jgi:hypothetical protein